jgi:hypothetical protein
MPSRPLLIIALAVTAALATGCSTQAGPAGGSSSTAATTPAETAAASPTPGHSSATASPLAADSAPASPLEGVWRVTGLKPDDMRAALQKAGLQKWIQPFMGSDAGPGAQNTYTLRILNDRWILSFAKDGGLSQEIDAGQYTIQGDHVAVRHEGGCVDTYRWSVEAATLVIHEVTNEGCDTGDGIPEEVYQTALYLSLPWSAGKP